MMKIKIPEKYFPQIVFAAALVVRVLYAMAVPATNDFAAIMRPDTQTYLGPAMSMLFDAEYKTLPAEYGGVLTALRVPAYPFFLMLCMGISKVFTNASWESFCVVSMFLSCVVSAFAPVLVYLAAVRLKVSKIWSFAAAGLMVFAPTAVAFAPMLLSDSLFSVLVALQLYYMACYLDKAELKHLCLLAFFAGIAALTRPLNVLWILPCVFLSYFVNGISASKMALRALAALLIFCAVCVPWAVRNHSIGAGWRIDAVSADSLKHNASVVMSRVTGRPAAEFRSEYEAHFASEFARDKAKFQDDDSKLSYQEKYLSSIIRRHPFAYAAGFFNPVMFAPDVPTLLENIGMASGGRGTWDVVVKGGVFAGVRHYFGGDLRGLAIAAVCVAVTLAMYLTALYGLFISVRRRDWRWLLFALAFVLYYIVVVGPVGYPRFFLPALPFTCVLAGFGAMMLRSRFVRKTKASAVAALEFRKAGKDDAEAVFTLLHSLANTPYCPWTDDYPVRENVDEDIRDGRLYVLAGKDGRIAAAATAKHWREHDSFSFWSGKIRRPCDLMRIGVSEEYQGFGIGRLLLERVISASAGEGYDGMRILVAKNNLPAQRLYRSENAELRGGASMYGIEWDCFELPFRK